MNYSGRTSFDFEIERYKNIFTGELVLPDNVSEDDFNFEYQTITLRVEGRSYFQSGKYSGPPENCYPDEGDTECEAVIGPDDKDWDHLLTASERCTILEMIQDNCMNDPEEYDDYDDDDYEPDSRDDLDDYEEDLW